MLLDGTRRNFGYALRTLVRSPGFALVALVTLALGIGADTAIFSVVDGVLLQPLPYSQPDRLVSVLEAKNHGGAMRVAWPNYRDWREDSKSFTGLAALTPFDATVLGGVEPVKASTTLVAADYWKVFPVRPVRGRLTVPSDHVAGAAPVVVVSRSFWMNELGGRPLHALDLQLLGEHARVVGVIPDGSAYPAKTQIWAPAEPMGTSPSRTSHNWYVVGRLAPGVSTERAGQDVDAITKRVVAPLVGEEDPDFLATGAVVTPLLDRVVGDVKGPLFLLLGAAVLVLLVACTNLASALLARGTTRTREMAVRASLGAGRGRIVSQLLTESLVLALLGAAGGVGIAYAVVTAIRHAAPAFLPRAAAVSISPAVLLFAAAVAVATALLFGVYPAVRLSRTGSAAALRSARESGSGGGRTPIWRVLVGAEVATALVLLVGSGLLVRSFQALLDQDLGFDPGDVEVAELSLASSKYPDLADYTRFYGQLLARVGAMPGVASAGVLSSVPIQDYLPNAVLELDGDMSRKATGGYVIASAGAFRALEVPLLEGRLFDERDGAGTGMVAVVNAAFARQAWPGQDPIGKQVNGGGMDNFYPVRDRTFARVVGVVGDVRHLGVAEKAYPTVYFPYTQRPFVLQNGGSLVVKATSGDPGALAVSLRSAVRAVDPDVPIEMHSMREAVRRSLGERRFMTGVMEGFSLLALILSAVGIFGVVSYSVARRTREIGIRMALGAEPGSVLGMVVRSSMGMVGMGLIVGLAASLLLSRTLKAFLYGIGPTDPVALAGGIVLLAAAAFLASWIPARRGTRIDPTAAMHVE
jgi:putative ABC transport system permease protein